ncbi:MAG: ABC transporter permease [Solirubrobacteraceae bacterium]|nr:ABC transporter permease [Solirubrobacteraceae bacterium]
MTDFASRPAVAAATPSRLPSTPGLWRGSSVPTQIRVLTVRSLRALVGDTRAVVLALLMPVIMLVLFSQVFSSLASGSSFPAGVSYIDYLLPAILVNTAMQTALQTGVRLTQDIDSGVLSRLRTLPIWLGSVLVARSLSDLVRGAIQLLIIVALAAAVFGYSAAGGITGLMAAVALALIVGAGLGWVFLAVATWLRNADLMQSFGMIAMFPLMFASSAYVPIAALPGWLQVVARANPMTYAVDAARNLCLGQPVGSAALIAIVISIACAAGGGVVASRGIRRP